MGVLTISKEFHFSASHVLDRLPSWHPCSRIHGHNYIVVLELSLRAEELGEDGFVRDYRDLDDFKRWVDDTLDHRHLNDVERDDDWPPSAENLALWIFQTWFERYPELSGVAISETPKTWATYRPGSQR